MIFIMAGTLYKEGIVMFGGLVQGNKFSLPTRQPLNLGQDHCNKVFNAQEVSV